jgi:hypothetical protein
MLMPVWFAISWLLSVSERQQRGAVSRQAAGGGYSNDGDGANGLANINIVASVTVACGPALARFG